MRTTDQDEIYAAQAYQVSNFDDEIRVDQLCRALLQDFHQYLLERFEPLSAGLKAGAADYFLRDFLIDHQRTHAFALSPARIRAFAGNWYIINNLEPNLEELRGLLDGVAAYCRFCLERDLLDKDLAAAAEQECARHSFFEERIDSFHALVGDGYLAWDRACPLAGIE